jgi:hypothetical protein
MIGQPQVFAPLARSAQPPHVIACRPIGSPYHESTLQGTPNPIVNGASGKCQQIVTGTPEEVDSFTAFESRLILVEEIEAKERQMDDNSKCPSKR